MATSDAAPVGDPDDIAPVRVAFDAGFLALPPSGIGTYVRCLLPALRRRNGVDVTTLQQPALLRRLDERAMRLAWDSAAVEVARMIHARNVDLLHLPAFSAPVKSGVPVVVTIHDVIPFVLPEYRASGAMRLYLELMRRTVARARLILTPSEASAADIVRVLGVARERVRVTNLAPDPDLTPAISPDRVRARLAERFGIRGRYLLSMAGFDRRKNMPLLVRAFARALPSLPADVTLVLAGAPHSDNPTVFPPIEPVIRDEAVGDRTVLTGTVTDEERAMLYQGALGYVTPSAYEGFGLTPLEAMACGVPVIAANRTSLPEVVGDAGMLVEPELDDLVQAITHLVTEPDLHRDLSQRSIERASRYSWDRTAELTLDAYREALRG